LGKTAALILVVVIGQHALASGRGRAVHVAVAPAPVGLAAEAILRTEPVGTAFLMLIVGAIMTALLALTMLRMSPRPGLAI
jgi:hypothetical protein